jgi:hypothetical protein
LLKKFIGRARDFYGIVPCVAHLNMGKEREQGGEEILKVARQGSTHPIGGFTAPYLLAT